MELSDSATDAAKTDANHITSLSEPQSEHPMTDSPNLRSSSPVILPTVQTTDPDINNKRKDIQSDSPLAEEQSIAKKQRTESPASQDSEPPTMSLSALTGDIFLTPTQAKSKNRQMKGYKFIPVEQLAPKPYFDNSVTTGKRKRKTRDFSDEDQPTPPQSPSIESKRRPRKEKTTETEERETPRYRPHSEVAEKKSAFDLVRDRVSKKNEQESSDEHKRMLRERLKLLQMRKLQVTMEKQIQAQATVLSNPVTLGTPSTPTPQPITTSSSPSAPAQLDVPTPVQAPEDKKRSGRPKKSSTKSKIKEEADNDLRPSYVSTGADRGSRRQTKAPKPMPEVVSAVKLPEPLKKCVDVLEWVMKQKQAYIFNVPVDTKLVPDYLHFVPEPMDLGTIKTNLRNGKLETQEQFAEEVRKVWRNAVLYNKPGHWVNEAATKLSEMFEQKFEKMCSQLERSQEKRALAAATPKMKRPTGQDAEVIAQMSFLQQQVEDMKRQISAKGKGGNAIVTKNFDNVPLSYREKTVLKAELFKLPSNAFEPVVRIISRGMPSLQMQNEKDEIEIDIDQLDTPTLRELQNYVRSVKKGGKSGRKGGQDGDSPSPFIHSSHIDPIKPSTPAPARIPTPQAPVSASPTHQPSILQSPPRVDRAVEPVALPIVPILPPPAVAPTGGKVAPPPTPVIKTSGHSSDDSSDSSDSDSDSDSEKKPKKKPNPKSPPTGTSMTPAPALKAVPSPSVLSPSISEEVTKDVNVSWTNLSETASNSVPNKSWSDLKDLPPAVTGQTS